MLIGDIGLISRHRHRINAVFLGEKTANGILKAKKGPEDIQHREADGVIGAASGETMSSGQVDWVVSNRVVQLHFI